MCDVCVPYDDLTKEQRAQQVDALSATFVGLPTVIGAPLLLASEAWQEVAAHQIELGVRLCADIPAIKTYSAPTPEDTLVVSKAAGRWTYDAAHSDTETPADRVKRLAKQQYDAYLAEVQRRREAGDLPPKE